VRPIREGERGPAVEDVQRRLMALGVDIGPTGVDGVFLGSTLSAVVAFQRARGLAENGLVGPETWSALVDATFVLGDRLLYLHLPYFHGADVRKLQGALNALGFAAGDPDGIFGASNERAVREFQANVGLPADGIVGPDTVRALENLRHVWADKAPEVPEGSRRQPAGQAGVLASRVIRVLPLDEAGEAVADRLSNLASASEPSSAVTVIDRDQAPVGGVLLEVGGSRAPATSRGAPSVAALDGGEALARRLEAALRSVEGATVCVEVVLDDTHEDEQALLRIAVGLLDGLRRALT
jgi:peptidoglycan hydrolase-like protein with peptidoglycan-binding domain